MSNDTSLALTPALTQALIQKITALADDELILAQRNSEWVGHAPILEEDIALANIAQDELGHAQLWLELRAGLDGSTPDELAFRRDAHAFRSARLVELPRGDWAFTLLRQFLFDAYEAVWLDAARASTYEPLRDVAAKALREEKFHLQHTRLWVERLGLGTEESHRRTQDALNVLWPLTPQLFTPQPGDEALVQAGVIPDAAAVFDRWHGFVTAHLQTCNLTLPGAHDGADWSREQHTEHLEPLLREMQEVARWDAEARSW